MKLLLFFALFNFTNVQAQDFPKDKKEFLNILCKKWVLNRINLSGKIKTTDLYNGEKMFLVFLKDGNCVQTIGTGTIIGKYDVDFKNKKIFFIQKGVKQKGEMYYSNGEIWLYGQSKKEKVFFKPM